MAKKGLNIEVESKGSTSLSEIAEKFFEANPLYNAILITEDGIVFDDSHAGKNAAENYCSDKTPKITYLQFQKS